MSATIKMSEANARKPGFSEGRPDGVPWKLTVVADGLDWEARSRYGSVRNVVVPGKDGTPAFERPEYREAPNTNIVAYGLKDNEVYVAILHEGRPHADDPMQDPGTENSPITFGQVPMGFKDKLFGKDAPGMEDTLEAAARELIYKAEYISAKELIERIKQGTHEGAVYRGCTSLSILMIFFATHPEYFPKD